MIFKTLNLWKFYVIVSYLINVILEIEKSHTIEWWILMGYCMIFDMSRVSEQLFLFGSSINITSRINEVTFITREVNWIEQLHLISKHDNFLTYYIYLDVGCMSLLIWWRQILDCCCDTSLVLCNLAYVILQWSKTWQNH